MKFFNYDVLETKTKALQFNYKARPIPVYAYIINPKLLDFNPHLNSFFLPFLNKNNHHYTSLNLLQ